MKNTQESAKAEHIGWDLWQATYAWKDRYQAEMINLGYAWYGEARASLMQHIPADGIAQSEIVEKSNLTKQAVQQLLDELELDGVVYRVRNPDDSRRKKIMLTHHGAQAFRSANKVKKMLEIEYQELLGDRAFKTLKNSLNKIIDYETQSRAVSRS